MFVILTIYKARNYIPCERKSIFLWVFEFVICKHVYNSQSYKCTDWIVLGKIFIRFIMINIYIYIFKKFLELNLMKNRCTILFHYILPSFRQLLSTPPLKSSYLSQKNVLGKFCCISRNLIFFINWIQ